jgi:hypothetical protein
MLRLSQRFTSDNFQEEIMKKLAAGLALLAMASLSACGNAPSGPGPFSALTRVTAQEYEPGRYKKSTSSTCASRSKGKCVSWRTVTSRKWVPAEWELELEGGDEVEVTEAEYANCPEGALYPTCLTGKN